VGWRHKLLTYNNIEVANPPITAFVTCDRV